MPGTLIDQLMQQLANRPGIDFGRRAVQTSGPRGAMYEVGRQREEGLPAGISPADGAIADRYAEGQNLRDRYGALAPPAAAIGAAGYEGVVKPLLSSLPPQLSSLAPGAFAPQAGVTSPSGGNEALLRALATFLGSMDRN